MAIINTEKALTSVNWKISKNYPGSQIRASLPFFNGRTDLVVQELLDTICTD